MNPLFPAFENGRYGFIDEQGRWAIPPQFQNAAHFINGLALVSHQNLLGYLKSDGTFAVSPRFHQAHPFVENTYIGCIRVADLEQWHIRQSASDRSLGPVAWSSTYSEGLLRIKGAGHWIYLDRKLEPVLTVDYDWSGDFGNGLARIIELKERLYTAFIDTKGKVVLGPWEGTFEDFAEACVVKRNENGSVHILDISGNLITPSEFQDAGQFQEGLCPVEVKGKWGYLDKSGSLAIEPQFEEAVEFCEGLAAVKSGDSWSFIDKSGRPAFQAHFRNVQDFFQGRALVLTAEGVRAYIDKTGTITWKETPAHG